VLIARVSPFSVVPIALAAAFCSSRVSSRAAPAGGYWPLVISLLGAPASLGSYPSGSSELDSPREGPAVVVAKLPLQRVTRLGSPGGVPDRSSKAVVKFPYGTDCSRVGPTQPHSLSRCRGEFAWMDSSRQKSLTGIKRTSGVYFPQYSRRQPQHSFLWAAPGPICTRIVLSISRRSRPDRNSLRRVYFDCGRNARGGVPPRWKRAKQHVYNASWWPSSASLVMRRFRWWIIAADGGLHRSVGPLVGGVGDVWRPVHRSPDQVVGGFRRPTLLNRASTRLRNLRCLLFARWSLPDSVC